MPRFCISNRARANLIEIYDYAENTFGAYQADAYYAGLIRTFGLLADFPNIGKRADELGDGMRQFRFQAHVVFYTTQPEAIEIRAIVHSARDIRPELFK